MNPTDRQREAFKATDTHRFVLFGGAGGGGKSYFLRWWCLRQLLSLYARTRIQGIRVGLFSMDYPTLTDRQISRINREFPPELGLLRKRKPMGTTSSFSPSSAAELSHFATWMILASTVLLSLRPLLSRNSPRIQRKLLTISDFVCAGLALSGLALLLLRILAV